MQRLLIERFRLGIVALRGGERGQSVERMGCSGAFGIGSLFPDMQGALQEWLRLRKERAHVQVERRAIEQRRRLCKCERIVCNQRATGLRLSKIAQAERRGCHLNPRRKRQLCGAHGALRPAALLLRRHLISEDGLNQTMDTQHSSVWMALEQRELAHFLDGFVELEDIAGRPLQHWAERRAPCAEQIFGNRIRFEEGAEPQEFSGGGAAPLHLCKGERPGGCDGIWMFGWQMTAALK